MWQQWLGWGLPAAQPTAAPAAAVPAPPERRIDTETGINWLIEKAKLEQALPPTAPREQTWFQPRSGEPLSGAPLEESLGEEPARPSFLPPEEGKPAWAQAPVPETWGEFPAWWAERQAGHVLDWWESAQEEIWGEPPEEQLDPGKVAAEQWKEAWEPAVTAYEAYAALPEKTPIAYLKALSATTLGTAGGILGGVIGAPIAGIKALKDVEETPGAIKALSVGYTALDQAARGVTGAVAGGFELFDTALVEQGILGVGAEIVWPLLQGHEADFTPQEFEAGRNRYSRWWNSVSAYSGELWKARMKGVDWKTSLDRAATRAGEATEELRSLTLDAVRNGATREDIAADATLTKPLAELAGRVILDPLNLMAKPGKTARMRGVTKAQARLINFEDSAHYDEIMDLMKAEGANNAAGGLKGPIWKMLHPNRADNATLAGRWAEDSTLVLSQMFRQATDPGEVSAIVRSMINIGDEGTDAARAAQVHLKKFGRMSQSATGKQTTLLLREMATDPKTGKLSLKVVGDWFADAKSDKEILGRIFESYDGAVARVFPTGKLNRVRRAQNQYRKLLSQYMYMGWNPGYAFRNGASNAGLTAISGWGPLESADLINAHVERWGSEVYGLRKGFGGPGGEYLMEKLHSALETIDSSYEAVRLTDLPASVIEDLAQKGIKGAPAMKLSEVVETASGEKIIHQSLEYFWAKHWRPKVPDELRGLFDRRALQSFERILADCVNPTELENALAPAMMGRNLPDGIDISKLPSSLRDGVRRALLEAEDADDFVRRMGALGDDLDTHLVKVLKETPASLSKGDPIVEAGIIRDRKKSVEAIEDAEYGGKLHKQVDTFDAQLEADRSKNLASVELAARYDEAHPGEGVGRMLADHAKNSSMTAKRVGEARDLAWQMYLGLPPKSYAEADVIWSATTGGPFDDLGFFPYRNREWGKYWAELDEPVTALYRRRPPIVPQKPMVAPVEAAPVKLADEWQEVPQGAVVEPGGEYRMDMEAGKSYARRAPTEAVRPGTKRAVAFGITDPNMRYEFEYRVVDLDDLVTSHTDKLTPTKGYPQELQARIRDRAASRTQIDRIAKDLNADALLTDVQQLDRGPMIIGDDLIVESGNGRVMALRRARDTAPEKYQGYTEALRGRLTEYGLSEADIENIKNPVLVRVRQTDVDRVAFAAEANYSPTLAMSLVEQATADAGRIDPELLAGLDVGATVSIDQALRSGRNRGFVEGFLSRIPANERATLVDASGVINRQGIERIKAAMFANTYGGASPRLTQAFVESIDPVIRNVENAMFASLPDMARAEGMIRSGQRAADLSLADDMAVAVSKFHDLKSRGASIQDYLAQMTFLEPELTPFQRTLLEFLNEQGRSPKAIREMLKGYAQAIVAQPDVRQVGMFAIKPVTREELLNATIKKVKPELGPLFAEAPRPAARAAPREELAGAPQPIRVEAREEIPRVGEEVRGAVEGVAAPEIAPSDLDAPDFAVRHSEIAEEILADITPNRQVIARVSNTQARQTLDDLAAAAPGMQWVPPGDLSPEDYEKVAAWVKDDLIPKMHESKLLGNKVALAERDFVLFNYGDRRHFDAALAYIFPYHYWYTRAATNIPRMLAYNPGVMAAYLKYKDCVHQINQEAQGLPWWEEQVKVPGTPFYLNLEATLNPLYSMINDFHNPDRTKTWQGEMLENLGNVGPSVDVAFWGLYAAWREAEGKPEEALASVGYLGQPTKAFRYATGLLGAKGGKGITLEPWMWDDPLSFTGLDYYERNRVGYEFKRMENEGAITPEAIWDEGRAQQGAGWDEAVSRQVQERAVPMLTSWLLGVGFKARFPYEIQVQKALNAQYQFYAHAEKTYDMGTEDGVAAYKAAQKQLYEYYPFLGYVKLVRRGELERDSAYTWEVLGRIQPGSNAQQLKEAAGVHDETIGKFYESHGNFEGWSDTDRAHFMASIEALGNVLGIPDDKRQKEWDAATTLYRDLKGDLRSRFGEDIFDIQAAYWDTRDICGADAADAIKEANPQLEQMWTARNAAIVQSPALLAYWGSLDTLDRVADAVLASETETRWPNYQEISTLYFKTFRKDEWKAQKAYRKDYLKQNPWLKEAWDFRDKMKGFLASEVDAIAAEMLPPLGPVVRDDTDLNSVLVERLMKVIAAQFEGGRAIKGPRVGDLPLTWPKGTPTTPAEVTPLVEGAVEAATETEMVDTETESVVQYGGAKRNVRRAGGGYTRRAAPTTQFSWQYVKAQLGQSVFGLIQHFNTKKPLGGELLTRLKDMFGEQPLGFGDFASWLRFLRTLWTASIVSSGGRGVKGVAERPKSFYGGMGQPGAGRRFLPWG